MFSNYISNTFKGIRTQFAGKKLVYKAGCFVIETHGDELIKSGIYFLMTDQHRTNRKKVGKPYVGQSRVSISQRIKQHVGDKIADIDKELGRLPVFAESKELQTALDLIEQWAIDLLEDEFGEKKKNGIANGRDQISKTSTNRKGMRDLLGKLKMCE
jgi:hypothetical protein